MRQELPCAEMDYAAGTWWPTVLVVGASRGIGLSLARLYAAENATVHATGRLTRHGAAATPLHDLARRHAKVALHTLDVRNDTQRRALSAEIGRAGVDVLIYSAGVNSGDVPTQLAINAEAPMALLPLLLPAMLRGRGRVLCLITSSMGTEAQLRRRTRLGHAQLRNYSLSKLEANRRFRALEPKWRAQGVTAVALNPGFVRTDMNKGRGKISAEASARAIKRALSGQPRPLLAGSFIDHLGRQLSWSSGQPLLADQLLAEPRRRSSQHLLPPHQHQSRDG